MKKWMFLLFVHEEFIFHLILMVFFLMNSLGKYLSAKCIVLLCNYYHSYHEKGPNEGNFLLFLFYIRYDALFLLQNDHLNGLLMGHNNIFGILFSERD